MILHDQYWRGSSLLALLGWVCRWSWRGKRLLIPYWLGRVWLLIYGLQEVYLGGSRSLWDCWTLWGLGVRSVRGVVVVIPILVLRWCRLRIFLCWSLLAGTRGLNWGRVLIVLLIELLLRTLSSWGLYPFSLTAHRPHLLSCL